jgi:hypothetical protein
MVGVLGMLLLNSKKVADHFKEQIAFTISTTLQSQLKLSNCKKA